MVSSLKAEKVDMPLLHFFLNKAIFSVILTIAIALFSINVAGASTCEPISEDQIDVLLILNESHISSLCKSASLPTSIDSIDTECNESSIGKEISASTLEEEEEEEEEDLINTLEEEMTVIKEIKTEIIKKLEYPTPLIKKSPLLENIVFKYIKNLLGPETFKIESDTPMYKYIVLFPEKVQTPSPIADYLGSAMTYRLFSSIVMSDVVTAELWYFTENYDTKMIFYATGKKPRDGLLIKVIAGSLLVKGGNWLKLSLKSHILDLEWLPNETHHIVIACHYCHKRVIPTNITYGLNPFIVFKMKTSLVVATATKNEEYHISKPFDVCKWPIIIDFKSLGWNEWIVLPERFKTSYCRGSCTDDLNKYYCKIPTIKNTSNAYDWDAPPNICCAPIKTSSLEIVYMATPFAAVFTVLPDIIVEECGCSLKIDH